MKEYVGYVFKIIFPNGKIYIGLTTKRIEQRYFGSGGKQYSELLSYFGRENLIKEVLCKCYSLESLAAKETYYIKKFKSTDKEVGYNKCIGQHPRTLANNHVMKGAANAMYGKTHTPEARAKISKVSKKFVGDKNPMFGKTHTAEVKEKLSKHFTGVSNTTPPQRAEHSERMKGQGNPFYGKKHSEDTKELLRMTKSIPVVQLSLSGEYLSVHASATLAMLCIEKGNVKDAISKQKYKAGGFIWMKQGDYQNELIKKKIFKELNL